MEKSVTRVRPGRHRRISSLAAAIATLCIALVAVAVASAVILFRQAEEPARKIAATNAEVFDRVWSVIARNYYDVTFGGVDWEASREQYRPIALAARHPTELYNDAIWPMIDQINTSHVEAVGPGMNASIGDPAIHFTGRRGEALADYAGGVGDLGGLTVVHDGKHWVVYDVRRDSEAEKLGIAPGRVVASSRVDTLNAAHSPRFRATLVLATKDGEGEKLVYEYTPRPRLFLRTRRIRPSGAYVIRFDVFDKLSVDWALLQLSDIDPAPVILDLRANRGGNIGQMLRLAAALLPDDAPLGKSIGRVLTVPLRPGNDGEAYPGPIAVLIGPQTASAGELLSYGLKKYRKAPLAGDRTAGAVLTARYWKLPDGGQLSVATGNFTTIDGKRLEGVGLAPTVRVAPTLEAIREGRDLVIEAAEEALLGAPMQDDILMSIAPPLSGR